MLVNQQHLELCGTGFIGSAYEFHVKHLPMPRCGSPPGKSLKEDEDSVVLPCKLVRPVGASRMVPSVPSGLWLQRPPHCALEAWRASSGTARSGTLDNLRNGSGRNIGQPPERPGQEHRTPPVRRVRRARALGNSATAVPPVAFPVEKRLGARLGSVGLGCRHGALSGRASRGGCGSSQTRATGRCLQVGIAE